MRRFIVAALASLVVAAFAAVPAAATSTGNRGQPNQDCEASSSAASGLRHRRVRECPGPLRGGGANGNPHAVSQYDVACFQLSSH